MLLHARNPGLISGPAAVSRPRRLKVVSNAVSSTSQELRRPISVDLEGTELPVNTHGIGKAGKNPPFTGKVLSIKRLGGRDKERDVSHIVIDTGGVLFHEGQSFGVQPPVSKISPSCSPKCSPITPLLSHPWIASPRILD